MDSVHRLPDAALRYRQAIRGIFMKITKERLTAGSGAHGEVSRAGKAKGFRSESARLLSETIMIAALSAIAACGSSGTAKRSEIDAGNPDGIALNADDSGPQQTPDIDGGPTQQYDSTPSVIDSGPTISGPDAKPLQNADTRPVAPLDTGSQSGSETGPATKVDGPGAETPQARQDGGPAIGPDGAPYSPDTAPGTQDTQTQEDTTTLPEVQASGPEVGKDFGFAPHPCAGAATGTLQTRFMKGTPKTVGGFDITWQGTGDGGAGDVVSISCQADGYALPGQPLTLDATHPTVYNDGADMKKFTFSVLGEGTFLNLSIVIVDL